jgi:hypothetical protein
MDIAFPSAYQAHYPGYHDTYASTKENMTVHARWWRHSGANRGTIVALHGWTMGDQRINSLAFLPGTLYREGYDVVLYELPFHGRRSPQGAEAGGLFPSTDLLRTNEAIGQSISDLRQLMCVLRNEGVTQVGWLGVSLGAYIGAVWHSLDSLATGVAIVPLVSMAEVAWSVVKSHPEFKPLLKQGITRDTIAQVYAPHALLTLPPPKNIGSTCIIGGLGDKMVPVKQVKKLIRHWQGSTVRWYRGGHAATLLKSKAFKEILSFLSTTIR